MRALRHTRTVHRYGGVALALLVLLSSATGLVLAWKKNSATLQPPTQVGASTDLATWRPWAEVNAAAVAALARHLGTDAAALEVDRYDVRPGDAMVKVQFKQANWEVQVDPSTLRVRWIGRRHADWVEKLHDLSIVSDAVKLVSMNLLGAGLLLLGGTGVWLWYGPRRVRRHKLPGN